MAARCAAILISPSGGLLFLALRDPDADDDAQNDQCAAQKVAQRQPLARFFADGAALRSAVDAGRFDQVDEDRAERTLCAAEDLVDAARELTLALDAQELAERAGRPRMLAVRAS